MFEKTYSTDELYILHISELIYYVPFDTEGMTYKDYYTQEYYTIATSKDKENFKDIFKYSKYKMSGYVGFGVMRDIEEIMPLKAYQEDIKDHITKREASVLIDSFVRELNCIEESIDTEETKKLELNYM